MSHHHHQQPSLVVAHWWWWSSCEMSDDEGHLPPPRRRLLPRRRNVDCVVAVVVSSQRHYYCCYWVVARSLSALVLCHSFGLAGTLFLLPFPCHPFGMSILSMDESPFLHVVVEEEVVVGAVPRLLLLRGGGGSVPLFPAASAKTMRVRKCLACASLTRPTRTRDRPPVGSRCYAVGTTYRPM